MTAIRCIELFSGIGGFRCACEMNGSSFETLMALDVNEVANRTYSLNFTEGVLETKGVEGLNVKDLDDLHADFILMSPPCQPFTRLGRKLNEKDNRCSGLLHVVSLIKQMSYLPRYLLLENVKNFEDTDICLQLWGILKAKGYFIEEYLLSPIQFGIPNTRLRYYMLAVQLPTETIDQKRIIKTTIPSPELFDRIPESCIDDQPDITSSHFAINNAYQECSNFGTSIRHKPQTLSEFLAGVSIDSNKYRLINPHMGLDIVTDKCRRSACFTKSYGKFACKTGSVVHFEDNGESKLRLFTPGEVQALMGFPNTFKFPDDLADITKYRLLGNSVNVIVVSHLIKHLLTLNI